MISEQKRSGGGIYGFLNPRNSKVAARPNERREAHVGTEASEKGNCEYGISRHRVFLMQLAGRVGAPSSMGTKHV